jgi:hypothetical protein
MELVVSMDGRGAMSSRLPLAMQPAMPRHNESEARMPGERISTLYAEPNRPTAKRAAGENRAIYEREITKKG